MLTVMGNHNYAVTTGEIGLLARGDRRASYEVVNVVGASVRVDSFRVDYGYETIASKIRAAGLPEQLAERLRWGT